MAGVRQHRVGVIFAGLMIVAVAGFLWSRADGGSAGGGKIPGEEPPSALTSKYPFRLLEVTEETGVTLRNVCGPPRGKRFIIETNGSGAGLIDYDLDGDLDLYIVNGSTVPILRGEEEPVHNALYRNEGDWRFVDVTEEAGVGDTGWGHGCAVGDIDGDGDPDLYVTNYGPNSLYENLRDGTFREIGAEAGVADAGWGHSAAFGDIDNDGDLDLFVCNNLAFDIDHPPNDGKPCDIKGFSIVCGPLPLEAQANRLYSNDGSGEFKDISQSSGIHDLPNGPRYSLGVVFGDYDDNGWVDIYVANDSVPNSLFHNLGGGKFEEVGQMSGTATALPGIPQAGMGVSMGDFDGDGRPDFLVTNFSQDYNTLYWNAGEGLFSDVSESYGLKYETWKALAWGTKLLDLDNDGDLDIYSACGHVHTDVEDSHLDTTHLQSDLVFENMGGEVYKDVSSRIITSRPPRSSRGAAFGDIDNDGDLDVLVVEMAEGPTLLRNEGGNRGNWIRIRTRGHKSNREGVGARVWVTAGGKVQRKEVTRSGSYCSSSDPRLHFGLGDVTWVERIEVRWPSGKVQTFDGVAANQEVLIDEEAGLAGE